MDLPAVEGRPKVTVKSVIDSFRGQVPSNFSDLFEGFVLLSPRKVRVTCRTPRALEEVQNLGLDYHGQHVVFRPCRTAKWVNVTRLSYGIPNDALTSALRPFGKILHDKMDIYQGVYVGVRNVLMEIANLFYSIQIAGHWCNIFYPGQTPTCFACRQLGHTRANCPRADSTVPAVDAAAEAAPTLHSPLRRDLADELLGSVVDNVVAGTVNFAATVGTGLGGRDDDVEDVPSKSPVVVPASVALNSAVDGLPGLSTVGGEGSVVPAERSNDLMTDCVNQASSLKHTDDHPVGQANVVLSTVIDGAGKQACQTTNSASSDRGDPLDTGDQGLKIDGVDQVNGPPLLDGGSGTQGAYALGDVSSTSDSDNMDPASSDDEHYEDAQEVSDSLPMKRVLSSGSSSDSSDGTVMQERKRGKVIQSRFSSLFSQVEIVNRASSTPLPDDDDDDLTVDPDLNTPKDPDNVDGPISTVMDLDSQDYSLTQPTPENKVVPSSASQPTDLLSLFVCKSTCPTPIVGTGRVLRPRSQSQRKYSH